MTEIDIQGLDRAEVLAALYNASRPLGLGVLHYTPEDMTPEEAALLLTECSYFDYLKGRVMKISLPEGAKHLRTDLYDRDNGHGAALTALTPLIEKETNLK